MKHIMLDLETLGTKPGSIILSIGATEFKTGQVIPNVFYSVINKYSSHHAGLRTDAATLEWWTKQSPEAKVILHAAEEGTAPSLKDVLERFNEYVGKDDWVWGNGASFDNTLLRVAYDAVNLKPSWSYLNDVCYRTLCKLFPDYSPPERQGVHHNALDDAVHQAHIAADLLERMRKL